MRPRGPAQGAARRRRRPANPAAKKRSHLEPQLLAAWGLRVAFFKLGERKLGVSAHGVQATRTVGRSATRTVGRSDGRTVGRSDGRTVGRSGRSDGRILAISKSPWILRLCTIFKVVFQDIPRKPSPHGNRSSTLKSNHPHPSPGNPRYRTVSGQKISQYVGIDPTPTLT